MLAVTVLISNSYFCKCLLQCAWKVALTEIKPFLWSVNNKPIIFYIDVFHKFLKVFFSVWNVLNENTDQK